MNELFKEMLLKSQKDDYINADDIEELVYNPELCKYFDTAVASVSMERFHRNNPQGDRKQFAKLLFTWIKNYDIKLEKPPVKVANIVFKVFYGEDIESCADPHTKIYSKIDGRKAINDLQSN